MIHIKNLKNIHDEEKFPWGIRGKTLHDRFDSIQMCYQKISRTISINQSDFMYCTYLIISNYGCRKCILLTSHKESNVKDAAALKGQYSMGFLVWL